MARQHNERPPFFVTQLRHLGSRRDLLRSVVLSGAHQNEFRKQYVCDGRDEAAN
jgi:hypothetical protein